MRVERSPFLAALKRGKITDIFPSEQILRFFLNEIFWAVSGGKEYATACGEADGTH